MYNVLIVDDQSIIRKSLKARIPWTTKNLNLVGEACNGLEALDIIEEQHVDILITDIKMPKLDGLGLISNIKDNYPHMQFILISSFDDFDYLKQAITYKVVTYILKPIKNSELLVALDTCLDNLHLHNQKNELKKMQTIRNQEYLYIKKNRQALSLLSHAKQYHDLLDLYNMDHKGNYITYSVHIPEGDIPIGLAKELEKELGYRYPQSGVIHYTSPLLLIICCTATMTYDYTTHYLAYLKKGLRDLGLSTCHVSVSSIVTDIPEIKRSIKEALSAQYLRFLEDSHISSTYYFTATVTTEYSPDHKLQLYRSALELKAEQEASVCLEQLFKDIMTNQVNTFILKFIFRSILHTINNALITLGLDKGLMEEGYFTPHFFLSFQSLEDILTFFKSLTSQACAEITKSNIPDHERIIDYIQANYHRSLTLQSLADRFYMNTNYLGQLIKKQTGYTYNQYVNALRIGEAKRLLDQEQHIKLNDLAHSIGYADSQYFSKMFRKLSGCTPSQYKKRKL